MSHHHHHHHCCCGDHDECHDEVCETGHGHEHSHHEHSHHEHSFSQELIEMADRAWMEVLYDKIKAEVEKHSGQNLEGLAKIVATANNERWRHKLAQDHEKKDFHAQVEKFFSGK